MERYYQVPYINVKARRTRLIKNIENLTFDLIRCIAYKTKPILIYNDGRNSGWTNTNSMNTNSEDYLKNSPEVPLKVLRFTGNISRRRFALVLRIMCFVHSNLVKYENRNENDFYCTKRAFFYSLKNEDIKRFVEKQEKVEWAIKQLTMLLECGPWELGFISTSKGLVAGNLSVSLMDKRVINYENGNCLAVPDIIANITEVRTSATFMLVVEKDSVFQKLLREECPAFNNCILVTGKGYPDISTRMFINLLTEKALLPTYALVDGNPHGFEIMCVYRFGTVNNLGYRSQLLCPRLRWLGVHRIDLLKLDIPTVRLTPKDLKKIQDLQNRSYMNIDFFQHLMAMKLGKAEIESVNKPMKRFLTEYFIPEKIRNEESI